MCCSRRRSHAHGQRSGDCSDQRARSASSGRWPGHDGFPIPIARKSLSCRKSASLADQKPLHSVWGIARVGANAAASGALRKNRPAGAISGRGFARKARSHSRGPDLRVICPALPAFVLASSIGSGYYPACEPASVCARRKQPRIPARAPTTLDRKCVNGRKYLVISAFLMRPGVSD